MRVINIVDRLDRVNFGIWNAAIATAAQLSEQFQVESEIWFPEATREAETASLNGALPRGLPQLTRQQLLQSRAEARLNPSSDLIVTHGCWQYPTRWGRGLQKAGFTWIAVPHGMLEKWSLSQKRLRKWIYFRLVEKSFLKKADGIRAVGRPEFNRLQAAFGKKVFWVPNGVESLKFRGASKDKPAGRNFLFMARLHHKKGIQPLLEGWLASSLSTRSDCHLSIAGPDDGELAGLKDFLRDHPDVRNISYLGAVYGQEKQDLLSKSHFYVLPSHSEGFPTSVLEAMQNGLVPLISEGCNFPDVFEQSMGIRVEPSHDSVARGLETALALSDSEWKDLSLRGSEFIESQYTHPKIAASLHEVYSGLQRAANR